MEGARDAAAIEALKGQGFKGRVQYGIRSGRTSSASGCSEATHHL